MCKIISISFLIKIKVKTSKKIVYLKYVKLKIWIYYYYISKNNKHILKSRTKGSHLSNAKNVYINPVNANPTTNILENANVAIPTCRI